jgi:hypothetical protein
VHDRPPAIADLVGSEGHGRVPNEAACRGQQPKRKRGTSAKPAGRAAKLRTTGSSWLTKTP